MIPKSSLLFRFAGILCACLSANVAVPMALPALLQAAFPEAPTTIPVAPVQRREAVSRPLTIKEQRTSLGRTGNTNPYLAGTMKWDVVYKGINLISRNFTTSGTDLTFEGGYGIPVNVTRSYSANNYEEGPFGRGWTLSADIRNTAGGLLKSARAPVRSVPENLKMRPLNQVDPNLPVNMQPVEAVIAADASGKEETIQRDLDGVLTTPAWDTNIVDSTFVKVVENGVEYDVLNASTVRTIDGTVYQYSKHGYYVGGMTRSDATGAGTQPGFVLKIDTVTDRQGNVTTYSYSSGAQNQARFVKSNGTTVEDRLTSVQMPNGHVISFTWGDGASTPTDRIVAVSDNNAVRVVSYTYSNVQTDNGSFGYPAGTKYGGRLASVTSAGGMTTSYGYMESGQLWLGGGYGPEDAATDLLTSITDPRGLTTRIYYAMDETTTMPYTNGDGIWAPCVWKVSQPNGINLYVNNATLDLGVPELQTMTYGNQVPLVQERVASTGEVLMAANTFGGTVDGVPAVGSTDLMQQQYQDPNQFNFLAWRKVYNLQTQALQESFTTTYDYTEGFNESLASKRFAGFMVPPGSERRNSRLYTFTTYNFMSNPLTTTVSERFGVFGGFNGKYYNEDKVTEYSYWGSDKLFQQKAVRTKTGATSYRYSFTDYYSLGTANGQVGQIKAVYDPKNGDIILDTSLPYPPATPAGSVWRYQVAVGPNAKAAALFYDPNNPNIVGYDGKGRPTDIWKLQKIVGGAPSYVQTHTTYGTDTDGSWGQASTVTEDYGAGRINRLTQTLRYTGWGVADKVQDAAGRVFETNYNLDGRVNWIKRTDVSPNVTVVNYTYGTSGIENGMVLQVSDGLSNVTQNIAYQAASGGGRGQVSQVQEYNGANLTSTVGYQYSDAGDRLYATYTTPQTNVRWWYRDYVHVGLPESSNRVFQTLTKQDWNGSAWVTTSEEFHYAYDSSGRLRIAAFAQTPTSTGLLANGSYYGIQTGEGARSRARAMYQYDPAGRLVGIKHYWDSPAGTEAIVGQTASYGSFLGLKTDQTNLIKNPSSPGEFMSGNVELFGYDPKLDYLTSASYDGGANTTSWSYDPAGNRNDATVVDNLNRATTIGAAARTYDILGNTLTIGASKTFGWDAINRLTSYTSGSSVTTYQYRADGMRVQKTRASDDYTAYSYDGQMPVEEFNYRASYNQRNLIKVIRYGLGARGIDRIERERPNGELLTGYPLYDSHGNNVATLVKGTNDTYTLSDQRSYDAWGKIRTGNTTGEPNPRYVANLGHVQDDESGLVYMRARYYEPGTGRFVSEDDARDGLNWFCYAASDPSNKVDPGGDVSMFGSVAAIAWAFYFLKQFAGRDSYTFAACSKYVVATIMGSYVSYVSANSGSVLYRTIKQLSSSFAGRTGLSTNMVQMSFWIGYTIALATFMDYLDAWVAGDDWTLGGG